MASIRNTGCGQPSVPGQRRGQSTLGRGQAVSITIAQQQQFAGLEAAIPDHENQLIRNVGWDQMEFQEGLQEIIADLHIALEEMDSLKAKCQDTLLSEWLSRKCEQVSEMCQALDRMKGTQSDSGHYPDNGILSSNR
ncbi:MAG: hypothetical protein QF898_13965 [SAR202 cluster bacterium]|jgi:hypothetical protein|nr:hypothetical protein [SAR202 cluster bacterium]MDP6512777.1 hypothetical protein [SAR202 cluster bacterium]